MTVLVTDPRLDEDEREALAHALYLQLRDAHDALADVRRPRAAEAPTGAKSPAGFVPAAFTASLGAAALAHFFATLKERLRSREVTLELDLRARKLQRTVRSPADFDALLADAARLLAEEA
ncbi:hypothetical protein [Nannocystis punicea]|uniref:Uncharacterized protein n=1 Tax=Nannocystis punicea TaxID=2995304 RepID=A0ABY7HJ60_9BACT|nr:hypothetical protein [Nannocystis poenicansa]WAS99092.1 hypothetical protein O0S08_23430 [Nannocystis poenicansa]